MACVALICMYDHRALGLRAISNALQAAGHQAVVIHFKLPVQQNADSYLDNPTHYEALHSSDLTQGFGIRRYNYAVCPWTDTELNLLPVMGLATPHLFHYDLSFCRELAWTNGYQELGNWFWLPQGLLPVSQEIWKRLRQPPASSERALWTGVALRRQHPLPFQVPYQAFYRSYRDPLLGLRYRLAREEGLVSDELDPQPELKKLREEEIRRCQDTVKKNSPHASDSLDATLKRRCGAYHLHSRSARSVSLPAGERPRETE